MTESDFATESPSATESELVTESDFATEDVGGDNGDNTGDSGDTLADTGTNGLTTIAAVGGALVVLLGVTLLAVARTRARPTRRH